MSDTYWLIERGAPAEFLRSESYGSIEWTTDASMALRFHKKSSAEEFVGHTILRVECDLRICEHMDCAGGTGMSDTPRTDAVTPDLDLSDAGDIVYLCYQLERELTVATQRISELSSHESELLQERDAQDNRIAELEVQLAAGKVFAEELIAFDPSSDEEIIAEARRIAKKFYELKAERDALKKDAEILNRINARVRVRKGRMGLPLQEMPLNANSGLMQKNPFHLVQ